MTGKYFSVKFLIILGLILSAMLLMFSCSGGGGGGGETATDGGGGGGEGGEPPENDHDEIAYLNPSDPRCAYYKSDTGRIVFFATKNAEGYPEQITQATLDTEEYGMMTFYFDETGAVTKVEDQSGERVEFEQVDANTVKVTFYDESGTMFHQEEVTPDQQTAEILKQLYEKKQSSSLSRSRKNETDSARDPQITLGVNLSVKKDTPTGEVEILHDVNPVAKLEPQGIQAKMRWAGQGVNTYYVDFKNPVDSPSQVDAQWWSRFLQGAMLGAGAGATIVGGVIGAVTLPATITAAFVTKVTLGATAVSLGTAYFGRSSWTDWFMDYDGLNIQNAFLVCSVQDGGKTFNSEPKKISPEVFDDDPYYVVIEMSMTIPILQADFCFMEVPWRLHYKYDGTMNYYNSCHIQFNWDGTFSSEYCLDSDVDETGVWRYVRNGDPDKWVLQWQWGASFSSDGWYAGVRENNACSDPISGTMTNVNNKGVRGSGDWHLERE